MSQNVLNVWEKNPPHLFYLVDTEGSSPSAET